MMNIKGLVIKESIEEAGLKVLSQYIVERYSHKLEGKIPVEMLVVNVSKDVLPHICFVISETIQPNRYYSHFICLDELWVIFPKCICKLDYSNPNSFDLARQIGNSFCVPDVQMKFEKLFITDHPDGE